MGNTKYLLYAEDDVDDEVMFRSILSQTDQDLDVVIVSNGNEVIGFLDNLSIDQDLPCFILLDLNMPKLNGFNTLSALKKDYRFSHIPVFLYTTSSAPEDIKRGLSMGAEEVLTKPFQINKIRAIVHHLAELCENLPVHKKG